MRSANKGIDPKPVNLCFEGACDGTPKFPHQVCSVCGFYDGKKILVTKADRAVRRDEVRTAQAERSKKAQPEGEGSDQPS
jgi:ribosomal protein L32